MEFILHGAQHREIGQQRLRAIVGKKIRERVGVGLDGAPHANRANHSFDINVECCLARNENYAAKNSRVTKKLNLTTGKQVFLQPQRQG